MLVNIGAQRVTLVWCELTWLVIKTDSVIPLPESKLQKGAHPSSPRGLLSCIPYPAPNSRHSIPHCHSILRHSSEGWGKGLKLCQISIWTVRFWQVTVT